ncbi:hypothetical protein GGTG_12655 [Gaeumannomyces tritici R3-111a-1]|uniref:Uncharacterized protein n=1 Tax=Gaeumannomyces tritici (strain R3-111a-1) TaxID=644352 RepID=J3PGM6_GAET3|nr:hypothetical protein GGTG_12655 [Gaeumannomyces tritici R3-111a-1]EJT69772.1 hypothetical protein GGTG_12655 [Gaeumannomyces tritici R3-111a-1]
MVLSSQSFSAAEGGFRKLSHHLIGGLRYHNPAPSWENMRTGVAQTRISPAGPITLESAQSSTNEPKRKHTLCLRFGGPAIPEMQKHIVHLSFGAPSLAKKPIHIRTSAVPTARSPNPAQDCSLALHLTISYCLPPRIAVKAGLPNLMLHLSNTTRS